MDNLSNTILLLLFLTGHSNILTFILSLLILSGILDITYISMCIMTLLCIYNLYGLTGVCVLFISIISFIVSGYMYWSCVSINVFGKIFSVDNNTIVNQVYEKTGISISSIERIRTFYNTLSESYNTLCSFVYKRLLYLRTITENIFGFRQVYTLYDNCINLKYKFDVLHDMFNLNNQLTIPDNIVSSSTQIINETLDELQDVPLITNNDCDCEKLNDIDFDDELDTDKVEEPVPQTTQSVEHDPLSALFGNNKSFDFNNMIEMNKQMEKQLANLTPSQRQQMDKMAMDMMGGIFGNISKKKR